MFERMARHRAISDMFKSKDSDEEEYEETQRKKLSKIDQELKDASVAAHLRELRELTQSILLETKGRFVEQLSDHGLDNIYEFQDFEISTGLIVLRRIFDGNGIML